MDYSAANTGLWNIIIQLGLISGALLIAFFLRRIPFIRKSLLPVSVMAGFILLIIKYTRLITIDNNTMEILVYHGIALGFIAMSLRVPPEKVKGAEKLTSLRSGAIIVSSYLVQGIVGLLITLLLAYTFMPELFKASGLLLPMGFGQGPGQANNVGSTYESLGFTGGRSFGLAVAAGGYIVACVVGVIILNILSQRGKLGKGGKGNNDSPSVDFFQEKDEIAVSDSIDKLSVQIALVIVVYLFTFLASWGITSLISAISEGVAKTVNSLIWGFNFIIGAALAMLVREILKKLRKSGLVKKQYQNNYLLNRISGFFFDIMIVAGIASINIEDIKGLWLPYVLFVVLGAAVTWFHLAIVCKKVYRGYYYEGLMSMYGMMTGTISSGVILLREIDPDLATPAANNLVTGSSFGIVLGIPVLALVSLAPQSDIKCWITVLLAALYYVALMLVIMLRRKPKGDENADFTAKTE